MYKKSSSIVTIAFKSANAFFKDLSIFIKYLIPTILLQVLAIVFLGIGMFFFMMQMGGVKSGSIWTIVVSALLILIGIIILINALWSLLIKMGALVLISKQIIENEPLKDLKYYTNAFKNRDGYITYLLITGFLFPIVLFTIALIICFFTGASNWFSGVPILSASSFALAFIIVLSALIFVCSPFLSITLQSFVLNPRMTPLDSIVKGMKLSGSRYFQSLGLLILYTIIVSIITGLMGIFGSMTSAAVGFSKEGANLIIQLLSQLLLPYWALCYTWWYLRIEKEERAYRR